jgi:hypothetical protein
MRYVIKNQETGKYVAKPGSKHSYTETLENARVYPDAESAFANKCGNEIAIPIENLFN